MKHQGPLALFGALAVAWSWPLVLHLGDAVPGNPGDNYSFLWNLWWMRHVVATPGLAYFHTSYLFYPFGASIADHPHTALPAIVAATLLKPASIVTAQNLLLLAYLFANMAASYALVWSVTGHRRAAVMGGVLFGLSPYIAVHLLGHFDLVSAWVLPAFALAFRHALRRHSQTAAITAGVVFAATAYIAYYYVVYIALFMAVYLVAWIHWAAITIRRRETTGARTARLVCLAGALAAVAIAVAIAATGGRTVTLGAKVLSIHQPQNALSLAWLSGFGAILCSWRPTLTWDPSSRERLRRAIAASWRVWTVFLAGAAPLLWQAAGLFARGEYVTPEYTWRSSPRGVDLLAPLLGHPLHPLTAAASAWAYDALGQNYVETVGWIGIVPLVLLVASWAQVAPDAHAERRVWRAVAGVFAIGALGPFLTIAGFDTGLKLPAILARYLPLVANARMPGRLMVGVFMALAVLVGIQFAAAAGRLRSPSLQWLLIALVVVEYWAPIRLTPLDHPAVYDALARAEPGAVCEVPFGIGDGLSRGTGSQDRRVLFYATLHQHPLVGGYLGRMPADAAERYARLPVAAALLQLSDGAGSANVPIGESPCHYLVVHRIASSAALRAYIATLRAHLIASDDARDLYRLR